MKKYDICEISLDIGSLASQAMIYEVACFPSPGLVSPVSKGSHRDMDFFTFIDSTAALHKYLVMFVQKGFSAKSCKEIFNSIRSIGIRAEKDMFIKTNGVNTHKGMLFIMGITCAAVGKAIYEKKDFSAVRDIIREMCRGIVSSELYPLNKKEKGELSHGEKLFLKYNTKGVRGEAEEGMPTIFNFSLDFYRKNSDLPLNDRLVQTLIGIMQFCDDSTILYRCSYEVLGQVKKSAEHVIALGGMRTREGREEIDKLSLEFVEKNISPGGSADLLGVTVFLHLVKKYINSL